MYIIKNALRCIGRSKGRNVLISIITLVIAVSACIGLSIRQAAESAKKDTLEELNITAAISYDRSSMMNGMTGGEKFDREQFAEMMGNTTALTIEDYEKYSSAESVEDFYYTVTAAFNGTDELLPVTDETVASESESDAPSSGFGTGKVFPGGKGGFSSSDFSVIGYSSDSAMTAFIDGTASVLEGGTMFQEGTTEKECVISEELAIFNDLAVGDTIVLVNPLVETETYQLKIVGFYRSSSNNDYSMSMFGKSQDPANQIYMSSAALQTLLDASDEVSVTVTDQNTGRESDSAITGSISATYVFENTEKYYAFEEEVRNLGLNDSYTVSSPDLTAFEKGLALKTDIESNISVEGNSTQLKQIVSILLDNAIRHSKEQSEVYLSLKREHSVAKLSVINKGDEIPQEQREQIFERFYRVDTARNSEDNSYGLGLAIAKAIAVSHKGKIEVQCYDGFVEFKVQIPTL
ncbi:MAG: HAMP domain-containing sensor histidine kinase [Acutalibacteraceae bacterium]|nr:HAMP domain-containing sensor histidine kinase [Acutalibacteraceae bacterium]